MKNNYSESINWQNLKKNLNKFSQAKSEREFDDFDIGPQSDEDPSIEESEIINQEKELGKFDKKGNPKLVIDKSGQEFRPRNGLEGPFVGRSGKVHYYDSKEGKYYCPYHDMYTETPMHENQ